MFKNPNNCGLSLLKKNDSKTKYIHDKNPPHKAEFLLNWVKHNSDSQLK